MIPVGQRFHKAQSFLSATFEIITEEEREARNFEAGVQKPFSRECLWKGCIFPPPELGKVTFLDSNCHHPVHADRGTKNPSKTVTFPSSDFFFKFCGFFFLIFLLKKRDAINIYAWIARLMQNSSSLAGVGREMSCREPPGGNTFQGCISN